MESQSKSIQTLSALKLPMLKIEDYDLWSIRMEQYLTHTDYALWEVIVNGDAPAVASATAEGPIPPKTFHGIKDANPYGKLLRIGLEATRNQRRCRRPFSSRIISQEDANLKLLRSLPSALNNIALIMRNKSDLDTLISSSTYADDVMFSFFANQSNSPKLDNKDQEQIDTNDLEEMDLKWTKIECYNCHRRVETPANALVVQDGIGCYDWSFQDEEGPTNFVLMAYTSQGSSSSSSSDSKLENASKEKDDLKLKIEKFEESSKNLTKLINSAKDKTGLGYDTQMKESEVIHSVFNNRDSDENDNSVNDIFKTGEGFHAVPPPFTGNFKPSKADLSFARLDDFVYNSKVSKTITSKDSLKKPKTVRPSAPIIEDWES
ncbi:hypothetical protein Tco_1454251, partial [Tanacetum coccineum]